MQRKRLSTAAPMSAATCWLFTQDSARLKTRYTSFTRR
jgi:hypothetical protein